MTLTSTSTAYVPAAQPLLRKHGAEILVGGGGLDAEPAQGDPPNSAVVISLADVEAAWGFLNDSDYQPVKGIRLGATSRGQAVVAREFTPASNWWLYTDDNDGSPKKFAPRHGLGAIKRTPDREGVRVARS